MSPSPPPLRLGPDPSRSADRPTMPGLAPARAGYAGALPGPSREAVHSQSSSLEFGLLALYVLSQCFTIPIAVAGPTWAVWPTLGDFVLLLLAFTHLFYHGPSLALSSLRLRQARWLLVIVGGACASYLVMTLGGLTTVDMDQRYRLGEGVGLFHLYRLAQGVVVFWVASGLPLSRARIETLSRVTAVALTVVLAGVALTFFSVVSPAVFVSHLPSSLHVSGPWVFYAQTQREGLGTIGYNHAYVASQALVLAILYLSLRRPSRTMTAAVMLALIMACFLTGSRAGLGAAIVLGCVMFGKSPLVSFAIGGALAMAVSVVPPAWFTSDSILSLAQRHGALLDPIDPVGLSGRTGIWEEVLRYLGDHPTRWLVGTGLGTAIDGPGNAHLLYLHMVLEVGLLGLALAGAAVLAVLRRLFLSEHQPKPVFWGTVALLISGLSQETFYPVPAFGGFLPFYLMVLAVALNRSGSTVLDQRHDPRSREIPTGK